MTPWTTQGSTDSFAIIRGRGMFIMTGTCLASLKNHLTVYILLQQGHFHHQYAAASNLFQFRVLLIELGKSHIEYELPASDYSKTITVVAQ